MSSIPDYAYAKEMFIKLNTFVEQHTSFRNHFIKEETNYWYVYAQRIFEDLKYGHTRVIVPPVQFSLKAYVASFLVLLVSFLSACFEVCARRGVLVFSVDILSDRERKIDRRLRPLYDALKKERQGFFEMYHTVPGRGSLVRFFIRKRPTFFLESIDILFSIVTWKRIALPASITDEIQKYFSDERERHLACLILSKYYKRVPLSVFRVMVLTRLLSAWKVKKVFMIDDIRNYHELILASRRVGITTTAIQHGHFTSYHVGYLALPLTGDTVAPDRFLLWSDFWKKESQRLNTHVPTDALVVGGALERLEVMGVNSQQEKYLLVPYERDLDQSIVGELIKKIAQCPGWRVIFKLREGVSKELQYQSYGLHNEDLKHVEGIYNTKEALRKADLVVGVYSTLLYDALSFGKHIAVIKTPSVFVPEALLVHQLADTIDPKEKLCLQLEQLSNIQEGERLRRRNELVGEGEGLLMEETLRTLLKK